MPKLARMSDRDAAAIAVSSLALGIGANVSIYSVIREMILDDPPMAGQVPHILKLDEDNARGGIPNQRQEGAGTAVLWRDGTLAPFSARTMPGWFP